jgi:uncharacterized protein
VRRSGVAVAIASGHPVAKLILEAPYTSTVDIAASLFPIVPASIIDARSVSFRPRIGRVTAPLLIMHGDADRAIGIRFGEHLFALAHEPRQFVRFPGGGLKIWMNSVLSRPCDTLSELRMIDGVQRLRIRFGVRG